MLMQDHSKRGWDRETVVALFYFFSAWNWFPAYILVTPVQYPLRFSIENKYDRRIYITTTLPKPYDVIRLQAKQKLVAEVNTTSTRPIRFKAYDFLQNTEILPINGQFGIQLTPGSTSVIPLAVPSADYSK